MDRSISAAGQARLGTVVAAAICVVVAGLVRWWAFADLHAADPLLLRAYLDDAFYVEAAARMARGETFDWFLAPLHPWLAAHLTPGGGEPTLRTLSAWNLTLGTATSGVVALAAAEVLRGSGHAARAAWCAGLLHALCGVFVFQEVIPGQEPVTGLAAAAVVLLGARLVRTGAWTDALGIGLATGIAALARGTSLAFALAAVPGLLAAAGRRRAPALALAAGLVLALAPASIRNLSVAGTASPFPWSGGANSYLTNGPEARAVVAMRSTELGSDPWSIAGNSIAVASAAEGRRLTPREASSWWLRRTWREADAGIVPHLGRKALLFVAADDPGSNHAPHVEREFASVLRVVPIGGWWLLCLGLAAWWWGRRSGPARGVVSRAADPAGLVIVGTWLALVVFFPVGRYRHPAFVAAAILVGAALPRVRAAWSSERRPVLRAIGLATALGIVAHLPVRAPDAAAGHVSVAIAMNDQGALFPLVEERLRRAIDATPTSGPANEMLGRLRLEQGRLPEALELLTVAARDGRTRVTAQVAAIPALVHTGRREIAWKAASGLLAEGHGGPELLAYAALAADAMEREDDASRLLADARTRWPDHPTVLQVAERLGR